MLEADLNPWPCSFTQTAKWEKSTNSNESAAQGYLLQSHLAVWVQVALGENPFLTVLHWNQNVQGKGRSQLDLSPEGQKQAKIPDAILPCSTKQEI